MQPLPVVAAIIERAGRILIAQRRPGAPQELLWEFPGGKVRFGEHPEAALVREITEELALSIQVDSLFSVESHLYHGGPHVLLLVYRCSPIGPGEPRPVEAQGFAWVTPAEMHRYEFALADWPVVAKLGGRAANEPGGDSSTPSEI